MSNTLQQASNNTVCQREIYLNDLDSRDIKSNRLFTTTITLLITLATWLVLVSPFSNYIPESFLVVSTIALVIIPYLNKRELGLTLAGYFAYVPTCLLVGVGLAFALYNSSVGEVVERQVLLQAFEKHQEQLSIQDLDTFKQQSGNISALRHIVIPL